MDVGARYSMSNDIFVYCIYDDYFCRMKSDNCMFLYGYEYYEEGILKACETYHEKSGYNFIDEEYIIDIECRHCEKIEKVINDNFSNIRISTHILNLDRRVIAIDKIKFLKIENVVLIDRLNEEN